ncbi:MAG: hypothetical protein H6779_01990 [Candidatus Nomurabacteria bacterium]|nr:hypothetical protein [Candidatus Nomurabacteria bacterium]USN88195.1 MAG: hypothetical protein H6779_01990 [Candidatus Nomurabacteria bacterium]
MTTLTVIPDGTIREGQSAIFTIVLSEPLTESVFFRASTITSGGASTADGDYEGFTDRIYEIPAGKTSLQIAVSTYQAGTINEGVEAIGLWVDDVSPSNISITDSGVGSGRAFVTILDPVEIRVKNTNGYEGGQVGFIVEAESPVPHDTTVYLQVQGTTTAGIASNSWWVQGVIKAGQTATTVNINTVEDGQTYDTRINVKLFSYHEDVMILDDTAYGTVYNTTQVQTIPILDIFAGGDVNEGDTTVSYARLSTATDHDVTFRVSTWLGDMSGDANRNPDSPDYVSFVNRSFTIRAGQTTVPIPVQTLQNDDPTDWAQEVFSIRVEPNSVSGATLGQSRADIVIHDVAITTTPDNQNLEDLSIYKNLINTLVAKEGISKTADIIAASNTLKSAAQSLEARELLAAGVWDATGLGAIGGIETYLDYLSLFPSTLAFLIRPAYKAATGLDLFDSINYSELVNIPGAVAPSGIIFTGNQVLYEGKQIITDNDRVNWTADQALAIANGELTEILKAGDYVDGRLVIHQPVIAFDSSGNLVKHTSYQGRYDPERTSVMSGSKTDNVSHYDENAQSFDWSGNVADTVYIVAPFDGYVVYSTDTYASKEVSNGGLGNVITLRAEQKTTDGKDVFVTFAHIKQGSITSNLITTPKNPPETDTSIPVKAGQVLGIVGDTGGNWPVHLHMLAGNNTSTYGTMTAKAGLREGQVDTPPVFMLFEGAKIATRSELNSGIRERGGDFKQDIGFPIGDTDTSSGAYSEIGLSSDEPLVAKNISSTFTKGEFYEINPTFSSTDSGGQGGDFPTPDPIWNGTDTAETNEYWQDKVSAVNEFIYAGGGYDFILASGGDDVIDGQGDGGQVNLFGPGAIRANFSVTTTGDGGYRVHSIDGSFGTDKYYNIDGMWFGGYGNIPGAWHNMNDLVINTFNDGDGTLPSVADPYDELFAGTSGDDLIIGGTGIDWFTATPGNDILYGGDGKNVDQSWNQVNFTTAPFYEMQWGYDIASDLLFSRHPNLDLDSYNRDITDFWFQDGGWHGRAELIGLASPDFVFV